nr:hypothetical protein [Angustibacter aerolatus]
MPALTRQEAVERRALLDVTQVDVDLDLWGADAVEPHRRRVHLDHDDPLHLHASRRLDVRRRQAGAAARGHPRRRAARRLGA